ncbi:MAG: hypothetical protein AAGF12_42365 [Myxococcota bacterium]
MDPTDPSEYEFTSEYNWCDSRCERCPLEKTCAHAKMESQRRWAHTMRGIDPDDPDVVIADLNRQLEATLTYLQEEFKEELAEEDPRESMPVSLLEKRLRLLSKAHTVALRDLVEGLSEEELRVSDAQVGTIISGSLLVGSKIGRLGAYLTPEGEPVRTPGWDADAVPNLLLLERVDKGLRTAVRELSALAPTADAESYWSARERLFAIVDQWYERVPDVAREALKQRIDARTAPSPFCQRPIVPERTA